MFKHNLPIIFQRLESAGILIAAGTLYLATGYALIWFVIMFLIIDLSAIGYLINTKLGAITYNLGHNYLSALTCALIASVFNSRLLLVFAIVWVCHVAIDRSLGFGLHFTDSFTHTHLGYIGKKNPQIVTEPREFQILSWNLLNDFEVPKHTAQVDRLPVLADQINRLILADVPTVAFFCEGTTSDRLIALAKDCGLVTVGQPSPYTDDDYMMFAVSPELLDLCSVEFLPFKHQANKFGVLRLMLGSQTIIGAHYPWRPIRDAFARSRATKDVLGHLPKDTPSLVMGDLNSMAWMSARRQLTAAGLHEIHAANKPLFPQSDFHGMTFPRIAPRVSIDAMYASTHYRESHLDYVLSPASDHPILSAVVNLPAN